MVTLKNSPESKEKRTENGEEKSKKKKFLISLSRIPKSPQWKKQPSAHRTDEKQTHPKVYYCEISEYWDLREYSCKFPEVTQKRTEIRKASGEKEQSEQTTVIPWKSKSCTWKVVTCGSVVNKTFGVIIM